MHSRSWPDLIAGIAVNALDGVEQRVGQFRIRRENSPAGRNGRQQGSRNMLHAQCCWTVGLEETTFSAGPSAAWASRSSSMRENTVARTWGSGKFVILKALR